jgi:DNA-binding CsgD family transcriptional regulator
MEEDIPDNYAFDTSDDDEEDEDDEEAVLRELAAYEAEVGRVVPRVDDDVVEIPPFKGEVLRDGPEWPERPLVIPYPELSRRQAFVALGIAYGLSNVEVAALSGTTVTTYNTHRGRILEKLRLSNAVQLCLLGVRMGWVKP